MKINTKYNIGDEVIVRTYGTNYVMTIKGIVIYSNNEIGYFEEYEESCIFENEILGKVKK